MAPPPPPSANLLRALRALTVFRPLVNIPSQPRRSQYSRPTTFHIAALTRQHVFHRKLHLPRAIRTYTKRPSCTLSQPISPLPPKFTPILPSPHLLARRFHIQIRSHSSNSQPSTPARSLTNTSSAPPTLDRGPASSESTQTNFGTMDILSGVPPPASSIDACLPGGFHLSNGVKIISAGVLIIHGEAFAWKPWGRIGRNLLNARGQWDGGGEAAWGLLEVVWPKPDLLILGLGPGVMPLAEGTRRYLNGLGLRVEVQDTRNAAAQFNLLATERGVGNVAAALIPHGWIEGRGV